MCHFVPPQKRAAMMSNGSDVPCDDRSIDRYGAWSVLKSQAWQSAMTPTNPIRVLFKVCTKHRPPLKHFVSSHALEPEVCHFDVWDASQVCRKYPIWNSHLQCMWGGPPFRCGQSGYVRTPWIWQAPHAYGILDAREVEAGAWEDTRPVTANWGL